MKRPIFWKEFMSVYYLEKNKTFHGNSSRATMHNRPTSRQENTNNRILLIYQACHWVNNNLNSNLK